MATPTYDLLASSVLTSSASSVTFSSISQDYRDLVLVIEILGNGNDSYPAMRLNSDSGNNYNTVWAEGNGSSASSQSRTNHPFQVISNTNWATATVRHLGVTQIMDYSVTDKHKSSLTRANNAVVGTTMFAGRWANTAAVTTIQIFDNGGAGFASGSTFYIYGVVA